MEYDKPLGCIFLVGAWEGGGGGGGLASRLSSVGSKRPEDVTIMVMMMTINDDNKGITPFSPFKLSIVASQ